VDPGPISYYLDFFRYGATHGGFGFGLTRLRLQSWGRNNVRRSRSYIGPASAVAVDARSI